MLTWSMFTTFPVGDDEAIISATDWAFLRDEATEKDFEKDF